MNAKQREALVAKTIRKFDWGNYGLDEVGEIKAEYADYARDLAAQIVIALGPELAEETT